MVELNSSLAEVIKGFIGSYEFINGQRRWCIFIDDSEMQRYCDVPEIAFVWKR